MVAWLGPAIGAIGSIAGGLLGNASASAARSAQQKHINQMLAWQRTMATHGVQWKVEDAKKAGIHPLAALGANIQQAAPIGASFPSQSYDWMGKAGQNLGRAVSAATSRTEQAATQNYRRELMKAQVTNAHLQNQYLASQIQSQRVSQPPGLPQAKTLIPGQGDSNVQTRQAAKGSTAPETIGPGVKLKPVEQLRHGSQKQSEAGIHPSVSWTYTGTGYMPLKAKGIVDQTEDDWLANMALWAKRNIGPYFGDKNVPFPAPKGKEWYWHGYEMRLRKIRGAPTIGGKPVTMKGSRNPVRKRLERLSPSRGTYDTNWRRRSVHRSY